MKGSSINPPGIHVSKRERALSDVISVTSLTEISREVLMVALEDRGMAGVLFHIYTSTQVGCPKSMDN